MLHGELTPPALLYALPGSFASRERDVGYLLPLLGNRVCTGLSTRTPPRGVLAPLTGAQGWAHRRRQDGLIAVAGRAKGSHGTPYGTAGSGEVAAAIARLLSPVETRGVLFHSPRLAQIEGVGPTQTAPKALNGKGLRGRIIVYYWRRGSSIYYTPTSSTTADVQSTSPAFPCRIQRIRKTEIPMAEIHELLFQRDGYNGCNAAVNGF
ncbi:hypothetical protein NDU88_009998 [Pleurodeles waltl]|uniref:Uncharacterized protein n=1 Tax=Pleurodeles waltl TaxID=8319 RepID=A0AAV7RZB9_PLEWA|nr:hypothetical protein NDU88_009998 [Pleurodeles waltl]